MRLTGTTEKMGYGKAFLDWLGRQFLSIGKDIRRTGQAQKGMVCLRMGEMDRLSGERRETVKLDMIRVLLKVDFTFKEAGAGVPPGLQDIIGRTPGDEKLSYGIFFFMALLPIDGTMVRTFVWVATVSGDGNARQERGVIYGRLETMCKRKAWAALKKTDASGVPFLFLYRPLSFSFFDHHSLV